MKNISTNIIFIILLSSCASIEQIHKNELSDGSYKQIDAIKNKSVQIENLNDTIAVYYNAIQGINLPMYNSKQENIQFKKLSFDVDLITIPVKYRPSIKGIPNQLTTDINASIYLGIRNDLYKINYSKSISGLYKRKIQHIGFSIGGIFGIGNTLVNEHYTSSQITNEYQGIVLSKGIAGIVAINNYTIGLSYGFDQLLDKNRLFWVYQQKPWLGLTLGLNIN